MAEGRYFFALWPALEIQTRLARAARQVANRGRLHHADDLHLTLVFLGQVSDAQLGCIDETAAAIRGAPFELCIDTLGYWYRPRILWAGPSLCPEPLHRLVNDLSQGLSACGFAPERRRYKPHITLYRKATRTQPERVEPGICWPVREFVLAASGAGAPGSPRYRVLKRWPLELTGAPAEADAAESPDTGLLRHDD